MLGLVPAAGTTASTDGRRSTAATSARVSDTERLRRWRLVLGGGDADGTGGRLRGDDRRIDGALGALYDRWSPRGRGSGRSGGLARSAPAVARWLGDIRRYFPTPVVQVLQRDAVERLDLHQLLLEPELLGELQPDLHLVTLLVELNRALPGGDAGHGPRRSSPPCSPSSRPASPTAPGRPCAGRWPAPAAPAGPGRPTSTGRARSTPTCATGCPSTARWSPSGSSGTAGTSAAWPATSIIAVDQSGSMAGSVVHASLFACVLARLPTLRTSMVAFDTAVADLTPLLADPVDVLFGVQLGGGTDIGGALGYCRPLVTRPQDTVLILVSDLFEGGNPGVMRARVAELVRDGVTVLVLLALSDDGVPAHDHHEAEALAALGATVTSCTPDEFPDVLAAAL